MASAIYILDKDLSILIHRQYKHDLDNRLIIDHFKKALQLRSSFAKEPVLSYNGVSFMYIQYDDIYLMSPTFDNLNVMCSITFLTKFGDLLKDYLVSMDVGSSTSTNIARSSTKSEHQHLLNSEMIKDNFILIYELFDEILDFGIPQLTEFNILKEYIKIMGPVKPNETNSKSSDYEAPEINSSISRTSTNKISWRPKGIFYNKNEIFINFNEYLKFKYSLKDKKIIMNLINGEIDCKSFLSGMPILKLALNETFEDLPNSSSNSERKSVLSGSGSVFSTLNFHQCVQLNEVEKNSISFTPPDGPFRLLAYQILHTINLKPLLLIDPIYRLFKKNGKFRLRVRVEITTNFRKKNSMNHVKINVPLIIPVKNLMINFNKALKFKTKVGSVVHDLTKDSIIWQIPKLEGNTTGEMVSEFELLEARSIYKAHAKNLHYGKQDKNDLIYFDLNNEVSRIQEKEKGRSIRTRQDIKKNAKLLKVITVEFKLNSMLYSDLKVTYLKIDEPQFKFQSFPWVRYCVTCQDDDYCFNLSDGQFRNDLEKDEIHEIENSDHFALDDEDRDEEDFNHLHEDHETKSHTDIDKDIASDGTTSVSESGDVEPVAQYKYKDRFITFEEYVIQGEKRSSDGDIDTGLDNHQHTAGKVIEDDIEPLDHNGEYNAYDQENISQATDIDDGETENEHENDSGSQREEEQ